MTHNPIANTVGYYMDMTPSPIASTVGYNSDTIDAVYW